MALSSFLSGLILNNFGWATLNIIIFPVVLAAILALVWLLQFERRQSLLDA